MITETFLTSSVGHINPFEILLSLDICIIMYQYSDWASQKF